MGRTARFEQIYVASLDAEPVETETLTGVNSILTREIEVNEVKMVESEGIKGRLSLANNVPTKQFSVGDKLFIDKDDSIVFDLKSRGRAERWFVDDQISIGTTNPTAAFQIDSGGSSKVVVDLSGRDLMTVNGNLVATNVIVNDKLSFGSNLLIDGKSSNVIVVNGGIKTSKLNVGSNVIISGIDRGGSASAQYPNNVAVITGNVTIDGGMYIYGNTRMIGNLFVQEQATYERIVNLVVADTTIVFGEGNDGTAEPVLLFTHDQDESNIGFGFRTGDRGKEMALFRTYGGPLDTVFAIDDSVSTNLHVFGDIYTSNSVGVANIYPTHDLCVGSNVYIDDTNSNVIYADGNVYAKGLILGSTGLRAGNLLVLDATSMTPVTIAGNVQMNALRTTGAAPTGISNLSPTDTISIGTKIFANTTAINTLRILGNTATTNLTTEMVFSSSNLIIHGDRFGGDSTSNVLILKSGPTASNVSSIEVYGASTSNTHQNIRFKTKNTERIRITSDGKVGISNTNPTERLTVSGNIYVIGSNTIISGNIWGSEGNTAMRTYASVFNGETRIENIVGSGKGLKLYASTTATMGTPKLTILESSNVGINVANPVGRLHTSGGTVFINDQPQYRNGYSHLNSPLVVTNTQPIVDTTDLGTVMHLTREGNTTRDGVRASFNMGKHDNTSGKSKAKLNISLSDDRYTDDTSIMTLLSSGHVGIGHTQPSAYLEIKSTGIGSATSGGLLVHNHDGGDAIMTSQTPTPDGNAFTSYIQTDGAAISGWSTGVSATNGDFRITQNPDKVSDVNAVGIFIDGTSRNVGIGTDAPRGALEVSGNIVIGQQLSFGGLTGDEFGNTHIVERRYFAGQARTELLLFKGNDSSGTTTGPDRIRHIAGEHVFQTYTSSGDTFYNILEDKDAESNKPLVVCDNGIVVVGGNRADADNRNVNTKLVVNGDIEFSGQGSFRLTGFEFETSDLGYNIIRSKLDGSTRRPLTFSHEIDNENDDEFARFDEDGRLGMGTQNPTSNIHVYDTSPGNVDIMRLQSTGDDKQTNLLIYTNDGEGGFVRGYSNVDDKTTGICIGVANNSTIINSLHLIHTSNVGVGTPTPNRKFHVYDGVLRVESPSSNASVELSTTGGHSNIYADKTGNVFIQPSNPGRSTTHILSGATIYGDLQVDGNIDFSQIGVGLGGASPSTDLHIGGGTIFGSNEVSRKTYSKTFTITEGDAKNIQILFAEGAFYAKITAILRRTDSSTVGDINTLIIDVQGGTGDGSQPSKDITVGPVTLFGDSTNSYPWSPVIQSGQLGISMTPYNVDSARRYAYDIFIELTSSCSGAVNKITRDLTIPGNLDNGNGGQTLITSFNY